MGGAEAANERRCGLLLLAVDIGPGGVGATSNGFFALAPAVGECSPARTQVCSSACARPWGLAIAVIPAGALSARVVSVREIFGARVTSPNSPGSHRSR